MIPIRLVIQGLYSYQAPQSIDFSQLTEAQIFGIFGATGSGKSSILEAITFALYGQIERLNSQDGRSYNMMNLKSNKLLIDFEFEAGKHQYRFITKGKRNSKRYEDVGTLKREAFIWKDSDWSPLPKPDAEPILGLSYPNFRRTIIIPQGKFQEFLSMGQTDRTRMLREIFGLGKYELAIKAGSLDRKNQENIARHEAQITQLSHASEEKLKAIDQEIEALTRSISEKQQHLAKQEKQLTIWAELQTLFAQIESLTRQHAALSAEVPKYDLRAKTLSQYQDCLIEFKPMMDELEKRAARTQQVQESIQTKEEAHQAGKSELERNLRTFESISEQYNQRESFKETHEDLNRIIELKELQQRIVHTKDRLTNGKQMTQKVIENIQLTQQRISSISQQVRDKQAKKPDLDRLLRIRDWFQRHSQLANEQQRLTQELNEAEQRMNAWEQEKKGFAEAARLDRSQWGLEVKDLQALIQQRQSTGETKRLQLESDLAQLRLKVQLEQYADQLTDGDPCPLCGSIHHPDPAEARHLSPALATAEQTLGELNTQQQSLIATLHKLNAHAGNFNWLEDRTTSARKALQKVQGDIDQHIGSFQWSDYQIADQEKVEAEIQQIRDLENAIKALIQQQEGLENERAKDEQKRQAYEAKLAELEQGIKQDELAFHQLQGALRHLSFQEESQTANSTLEQRAVESLKQYESIGTLYQRTESQIQKRQSNLATLQGEINELHKQAKTLQLDQAKGNQRLTEKLKQSDFESVSQIHEILHLNLSIEAEQQAIRSFHQELHTVTTQLSQAQAQAKGKSFDPKAFEALQEEIQSIESWIAQRQIEQGALQKEQERLKADLAEKTKLEASLRKLQIRAENLRIMKNMFNRSGFVNYVSTRYLQHLCVAANHRFTQLTRRALSLEVSNNHFQVRDFLNDGQTRSVKTLSGGQTFQAALSLALALADQVHQQAHSERNFFFLDEGFGSQDKHSLQIIFQTLKSLRKENRIVGVISHVEDLQQEIDTYLQIENSGENGSKVNPSWEI
ncbi:SMC family ATPase [Pontibacter sp. G13]|uniref:SMC family ATPase n=1 Tax=Pontibacter sp. G13 TaxID=3074898 RepID=UPI0028893458|nr:SMC family ATPase [Pontibacter sp. G13]WNJ16001.1 SMC family ATPase [Pontibacter sp. G13]